MGEASNIINVALHVALQIILGSKNSHTTINYRETSQSVVGLEISLIQQRGKLRPVSELSEIVDQTYPD